MERCCGTAALWPSGLRPFAAGRGGGGLSLFGGGVVVKEGICHVVGRGRGRGKGVVGEG